MTKIIGTTILQKRGDIADFDVTANFCTDELENIKVPYTFKKGDIIRFKVFERKNCSKVFLQKDIKVEEETIDVNIYLTGKETKIGELINEPKTYWYEIELNPDTKPQSIISYDEYGEKQLILYPEGGDK